MIVEGSFRPVAEKLLTSFFAARKKAKVAAAEEVRNCQKGDKPWPTYGSGVEQYQDRFESVLKGRDLSQIISPKRSYNGSVNVLELFGDGQLLRELPEITQGVAVTLTDARTIDQIDYDRTHNIQLIAGDVLAGGTWSAVNKNLVGQSEGSRSGFDLVTVSPVCGWEVLGSVPKVELQWLVLNKAYRVLSSKNGELLFEMGSDSGYKFRRWLFSLVKGSSININYDPAEGLIGIVKTSESPVSLPRI